MWVRKLVKLCRRKMAEMLADVHTHFPAKVISYDSDANTCVLQPCLNRLRSNDPRNMTNVRLPVLEDVPVKQFGSGKCLFTVAPQEGAYGWVEVSERSFDKWLVEGGIVDPISVRKFDLSDVIFDPGLYPLVSDGDNGSLQAAVATDRIAMRTRTNDTFISVVDDDSVEIESTGDVTITTPTCVVNSDVDAAALASAVDTYISQMDTLIRTTWLPPVSPAIDNGLALKTAYIALFEDPPSSVESASLKVDQ